MKFLINRTIWQKIIIAFFLVIMLFSVMAKPVQAMSADILLKPITGLFVGLADGLEGVMQKIVIGQKDSLITVTYNEPQLWEKVLIIGAFVIGAIAAAVLSYYTFGVSAAIYIAVVIAVGVVAINIGTCAIYGESLLDIVDKMLSNSVDFPQFALSPYEIFDNKITVLDVNFFNPKENERIVEYEKSMWEYEIPSNLIVRRDGNITVVKKADFDREYNFDENNVSEFDEVDMLQCIYYGCSFDFIGYKFYEWYDGDKKYQMMVDNVEEEGVRRIAVMYEERTNPIRWLYNRRYSNYYTR